MKYEDFPILNTEQYHILNEHYGEPIGPNRKTLIQEICSTLQNSISFFNNLNNLNSKTQSSIAETKQSLFKILNNLSSLFNVKLATCPTVSSFGLFLFMSNLVKTTSLFNKWIESEEKLYYRKIAVKNSQEVLSCFNNILLCLNESFVSFYRHMWKTKNFKKY